MISLTIQKTSYGTFEAFSIPTQKSYRVFDTTLREALEMSREKHVAHAVFRAMSPVL